MLVYLEVKHTDGSIPNLQEEISDRSNHSNTQNALSRVFHTCSVT
ncbi:MAG: hypothetical protein SAL07_14565 [Oscillatoria sp. PMC 1051.18]|nr:hypothetical protein [Oscillatoria sp. PMC 1051.18]